MLPCLIALVSALTLTACKGREKRLPSDGLDFALNDDGASYSVIGIGTCTDTEVIIPNTYHALPVTTIGNEAFYYCSNLRSITFEGTVEQWKSITKGSSWKHNVPATKVICSDGTVALN